MADSDFSFGGVLFPSGTKRLYVTATLVPSTGDPRIQPTGFPDIGPVLYPDPSTDPPRQVCLIESEASMANRLEEVAVADKYTGSLLPELEGLPYIKVVKGGRFMTASTLDGHRFASSHIMKSAFKGPSGRARKDESLVAYVKRELDGTTDNIPAANVPRIFRLAMELDPLSLVHGFQISLKGELTFVGLRSPRALTACIVGLNAQPVGVPGIRLDPLHKEGESGDAGQAIFRKERIVAQTIQANFTIDVGLLSGLPVGEDAADKEEEADKKTRLEVCNHRRRLLIALSLWKIALFLKALSEGHRLRTECDLVLQSVKYKTRWKDNNPQDFPFEQIASDSAGKTGNQAADGSLQHLIAKANLPGDRSPLTLEMGG